MEKRANILNDYNSIILQLYHLCGAGTYLESVSLESGGDIAGYLVSDPIFDNVWSVDKPVSVFYQHPDYPDLECCFKSRVNAGMLL